MTKLNNNDVIELLYIESDIRVEKIIGSRFYLSYAPIDIPGEQIKFSENKCYMESTDVAEYIAVNVFGSLVEVIYNTNQDFCHFLVG